MMKYPDAILVGDLHATDSQPLCRVDDFRLTQIRKGEWLKQLWRETGRPPILQVGDVFERWKSSPQVISMLLEHYPPMITIPGNHDLPEHNLSEYYRSALRTLEIAGADWIVGNGDHIWVGNENRALVDILPWGSKDIIASNIPISSPKILLAHTMILDGPAQFEGEQANSFLERHSQGYKLIVTGHNHKPIWVFKDTEGVVRRHLVNVGSFTRQTASETHQPRVYLWYSFANRLEERIVPHDPDAITREHIEHKQEHDEKIVAFIDKIKASTDGDVVEVSFKVNVEMALNNVEISESVKSKLRRMLYGDGK